MKKGITLLILISVFSLIQINCARKEKNKEIIYIGTYTKGKSKGIYVFNFDRKKAELNKLQTVSIKGSPSFLSIHPNKKNLYAGYETDNYIRSFSIDSNGQLSLINKRSSHGDGPCHVSIDPQGKYVYVSNYGSGSITVYPLSNKGSLKKATEIINHKGSGPNKKRQNAPHMHSIIPSPRGRYIYASDLGIDKIITYQIMREADSLKKVAEENTPPGSGPRHFDFHPSGKFAYSVEELTSTISVYSVNEKNGQLKRLERKNLLPKNFTGYNKSADIQVSPDGKHVYVSNRGHNSITIFSIDQNKGKIELVERVDVQGKTPRNLFIDKKGEFVFVANRNSDNITIFKRVKKTGQLKFTGKNYQVPAPVCIHQLIK